VAAIWYFLGFATGTLKRSPHLNEIIEEPSFALPEKSSPAQMILDQSNGYGEKRVLHQEKRRLQTGNNQAKF
jgi:hypothetical protein